MRILFLGDVMGRSGRDAVIEALPRLRDRHQLDFVIVNGENAAGGFGITPRIAEDIFAAGADVITTGNHIWDQPEIQGYIDEDRRLLRPANFPDGTPGVGVGVFKAGERQVMVINIMGQLFMNNLDCPFATIDRILGDGPLGTAADAVIVDIHAEASSEKMAMGHHCDSRVSLVVGTHTHIPTADAQILPHGTAYMSDAGMCGDYDSVIGMQKDESVYRFVSKLRRGRFQAAEGEATLCGVFLETDDKTGLALRVEPLRIGGRLASAAITG